MFNAMRENNLLYVKDIEVLLALENVEGYIGFSAKEELDEECVIQQVYQLVKREIIAINNEKVKILEPFATIIQDIKKADVVIQLETSNDNKKKCCYFGEKILVSELSESREHQVVFYYLELEDFVQLLEDEKYIPSTDMTVTQEKSADEMWEAEEMEEKEFVNINIFYRKEFKYRIMVFEKGLYEYICVLENIEEKLEFYTRERMKELLTLIQKGEKI